MHRGKPSVHLLKINKWSGMHYEAMIDIYPGNTTKMLWEWVEYNKMDSFE